MAKLIGTDPNQVPTNADLGTMAYQKYDPVSFQVSLSSAQQVPTASHTTILYDNVVWDTHGNYTPSTGRYTITQAGIYNFGASIRMDQTGNCRKIWGIYKNQTQYARLQEIAASFTSGDQKFTGHVLVPCSQGDEIEVRMWVSHADDFASQGDFTFFEGHMIHPVVKGVS